MRRERCFVRHDKCYGATMPLAAELEPTSIIGPHIGTVTDVADPEGRYRVKVEVPGLSPESDWAEPFGTMGGGGPQRGGFVPPKPGDTVLIFWVGCDSQFPIYIPGWWGITDAGPEMPEPAKSAGDKAHQVACLQIGSFRFSVDERDGKLVFSVVGQDGETPGLALILDFTRKRIELSATAAILMRSKGKIWLDALSIQLRDRMLDTSSKPV